MKEHPILFSGPMVRAILGGKKSQTRRVVKPQPTLPYPWQAVVNGCAAWSSHPTQGEKGTTEERRCPYGDAGSTLWVKEAWRTLRCYDDLSGSSLTRRGSFPIEYDADKATRDWPTTQTNPLGRYRHARFMPRIVSRLTLEIVRVRCELLQAISEEDAIAEGVTSLCEPRIPRLPGWTHREGYKQLWDQINGKKHPWSANPWVWVVEFRRAT